MDCTICVAKTKALISFAVTAKLICVFVFAYAKSRFSHDEAHIYAGSLPIVIKLCMIERKSKQMCFFFGCGLIDFHYHIKGLKTNFLLFSVVKKMYSKYEQSNNRGTTRESTI